MKLKCVLPIVCVFALFGCMSITTLEGQVVDQAKVIVNPSNGVIPGELVEIIPAFLVVVDDNDPEWYATIEAKELLLRFYSLDDFRIQPGNFRLPAFSFELLNQPFYRITLETLRNPFPVQEYTFPIDWRLGRSWLFKGEDGRDGSVYGNGYHGENGPDIVIEAAYYDVSGTALEGTGRYAVVHAPQYKKLMLVNIDNGFHTISSAGGKGGKGREGESNYGASESNPDVYGGDGGPGADGGDGGYIEFYYPAGSESVVSHFRLKVPGGAGGEGGDGGRGSEWEEEDPDFGDVVKAVIGVNYGSDGRSGRSGRSGTVREILRPLDTMFVDVQMAGFDRSRLILTPAVKVSTPDTITISDDSSDINDDTDATLGSENTDESENLNEAESTEISPENYEDRARELVNDEMQ